MGLGCDDTSGFANTRTLMADLMAHLRDSGIQCVSTRMIFMLFFPGRVTVELSTLPHTD